MIEILALAGILLAVHSLCAANAMHKKLPSSLGFELVLMFGFAVGTVVACWNFDLEPASIFFSVSACAKIVSIIDLRLRGYSLYFSFISVERRSEERAA